MPDEIEERRQQDRRDLEFYSKRVRPTVSDLLRTTELSWNHKGVSQRPDKSRERNRAVEGLDTPASLADLYADSRYRADPAVVDGSRPDGRAGSEAVWSLVAAAIVLILSAWHGDLERAIEGIVF